MTCGDGRVSDETEGEGRVLTVRTVRGRGKFRGEPRHTVVASESLIPVRLIGQLVFSPAPPATCGAS